MSHLHIIIGTRNQGKTFLTKRLIEGKNCLIFDVNNEYGEVSQSLAKQSGWIEFETVSDDLKEKRARYFGKDMSIKEFVTIAKTRLNTFLVFEDATGFLKGNTNAEVRQMITALRHTNNNILFLFHSINSVPPDLLNFASFIYLFKTNDSKVQVKRKFPELYDYFYKVNNNLKKAPIILRV
jgi:hypothetical protein